MGDDVGMGMSFGFDTRSEGKQQGKQAGQDDPGLSLSSGAMTYKPFPLRIMAVANFRGAPDSRAGDVLTLSDKSDLDGLPGKMGVQLFFDVEDVLRNDPKGIEVRYRPQAITDLRPNAVMAGIPELNLVTKLLDELKAVESGQMTSGQFLSGLSMYAEIPALGEALRLAQEALGKSGAAAAKPSPSPAPAAKPDSSGDATLDSILSMVAAPGEDASAPPPPPKPKSSAVGGLISAVAASARGGSGAPASGAKGLGAARQAAQGLLSRQLDLVFHHPQFRQVESAWLGLKLLVDRCDLRQKIRVELCDADPTAPADGFHERVFPIEYEGRSEDPLSMTIVDFAFANTAADQAVVEQLANDAEQIQAPVIVSLATEFFGVESMAQLGSMDNAGSLFETGYARWDGFRKTEPSRWLAAACNRMLLRAPYKAGSRRSSHYNESAAELLWANAGWALGVTVAHSQAELGWPTSIGGLQHSGPSRIWPRQASWP
jgi:predicted component of type VI protein secretion system